MGIRIPCLLPVLFCPCLQWHADMSPILWMYSGTCISKSLVYSCFKYPCVEVQWSSLGTSFTLFSVYQNLNLTLAMIINTCMFFHRKKEMAEIFQRFLKLLFRLVRWLRCVLWPKQLPLSVEESDIGVQETCQGTPDPSENYIDVHPRPVNWQLGYQIVS